MRKTKLGEMDPILLDRFCAVIRLMDKGPLYGDERRNSVVIMREVYELLRREFVEELVGDAYELQLLEAGRRAAKILDEKDAKK